MKIFVCIKQVPDTETKVRLASDGKSLDTTAVKWVMNPYDEYAVEEAVKIRDANPGSQVHVITVGPKKRAPDALRTALAMGADEGIVVDAPEGLDTLNVAKALAKVITDEGGGNLVLTGKLAIDDNASSVGPMLAEFLKWGHTSVASKITVTPENAVVERDIEGGAKEVVQVKLPAVIAANKGLNMPRYASLPGIMKAKKKTLKELEIGALGVPAVGKVKVLSMELPAEKPAVKMLTGDAGKIATELVHLLRDDAKVL